MAKMKVNGLNSEMEPVTPGVYTARVESFDKGESRSSGKPMFKVRLTIVDDGPFCGRSLFDNFMIDAENPIGRRRLAGFLKAANVDVDEDDEFDSKDVIDSEVKIAVETEEDQNGDKQDRIKRYIRA